MQISGRGAALAPVILLVSALGWVGEGEPAAQRIQFEKGKSAAVLHKTLKVTGEDAGVHTYQLRASAGQVLKVNFEAADPDGSYSVACPGSGMTGAGAKSWSMTLPESGDYTLTVAGYGAQKSFPYTLEVSVEGAPHPVAPQGFTGTWLLEEDADQSIETRELPGHKLLFAVHALWKGANWEKYGPNIGETSGTIDLRNGKAVFKDLESECTLTFTFKGDRLAVGQEGSCGFGMNVRADGAYKRTSLCAAPEKAAENR